MSFSRLFQSVDCADEGKLSASDSSLLRITNLLQKKTLIERPTVPVSGESRYLTQLWVFRNQDPWEELHPPYESPVSSPDESPESIPDKSPLRITGLELRAEEAVILYHEIKGKIRAVLKLLTFRDPNILVQFWSPQVLGKHRLLTTVDQPFGLGAVDERLISYRKDSECNQFLVNNDHEEEDSGPPARVYRRELPEWTSDIWHNYMSNDFPLRGSVNSLVRYGYLALPVFDSATRVCVGVLELVMAYERTSYAYEAQQIHSALKKMNLTTPQTFDQPTIIVPIDQKQNRMDKIHGILEAVCHYHGLPIAQTWAVSPFSSYVAHEGTLQKICSSFNTKCIGKVCMSTYGLPFYVRDPHMWHFREACREQHLEKTRGIVGQALVTRGSCYCGDVSELSKEEYPLAYNAHMSGLTSCFTIFLHSLEGDDDDDDEYVLEFFLLSQYSDHKYILELVESLKYNFSVSSGFKLGDVSSIEDVEPHIIPISSTTEAANTLLETSSSDSEPIVANVPNSAVVPSQVTIGYAHGNEPFTDAGKKNSLKQGRKRKLDSLTLEAIQQHLGMPIGQAAESLSVSRSTLKRFCREHNISSWPMTRHNKNDRQLPYSDIVHGSPKTNVVNVMDMDMLTVKVSFKEHMIRFTFPISSGLLELENEVARRIKLEGGTRVLLKYRDEEGDWVLITCDADLHSVIRFLGSNTTLKLIVELADFNW